MKYLLFSIAFLSFGFVYSQSTYKQKMNDPSVNFYDVVREAELYFETHGKGKGSGWKGYQRWKAENETKYYPSGDRSNVNPYFLKEAYETFIQQNPVTEGTVFDSGWRDLGPYDANNITTHYSPGIGRVECLWINPTDDQHIYMGSRSGGFWRTTDGGTTWQNTTDFLVASGVNTMAVNPNNPDSILINVRNGGNSTSHGIYRSTDGGLTWTLSNFNPTNLSWGGLGSATRIHKIAYHPTVEGLVFIGTTEGLYRSTDDLATWTQPIDPSSVTDIEFHPTNTNTVYVYDDYYWGANQNVVMVSTNLGVSFTQGGMLTGNNDVTCFLATSPDCPNCVYVGSSNGVWKSTNSGTTFTFLINPNESCRGFAVSDMDDDNMIYGYVDLEASTNGGTAFNQVTWWANGNPDPTYVHADLRAAECVNGVFYVGTDGYLAKSTDNGQSWIRLNDGTGIRENYAVGVSQSNRAVHMAGSQDNGTSILNDNGWIEWNGGDGMEAIIQTLNPDWMIGSWQYGTRQRTKDGGQTRQGIQTPQSGSSQAYWVAPMFFDPVDQMRVYHFSDSLFASDEFGGNWQYIGFPDIGIVTVAAIANNNSDRIIAIRNSNIRLSQNGGQTWSDISSNLPGHGITDVAFDPNDDNTIVVTYNRFQNDGQKIYISHNLGASWTNITHNLGDMPLRTVVIDHTPAGNIYVGGEIGVYYKPMSGNTWTAYNTNLPNVTVRDLEIQNGSNSIKAATWGRGLWDYSLVGRKDFPSIITTEITQPPSELLPLEGIDQIVTSVISYDNTLSSVFVKWSANDMSLSNTITMTNTMDSTWVSQTGIPGALPEGTEIFFKVFAVGNNMDTTETYRYMYTIRPFEYCISSGNMDFATAVTLVDFNTINNSLGKTQPYTDYRNTDSTNLTVGDVYNLTVNLNTDGNYTIYAKAWIDWNQNASFDDPGEEYDLGSAINTVNGPTTNSPLSITVPNNALLGKTAMRVSCQYFNPPTACGQGFDGEVEDYSLIIETCQASFANLTETVCDSYTSPSGNTIYTTSGTYQDTLMATSGCDSLITIDLTILETSNASINPTACDVYTSPGGTIYLASGIYNDTLMNAAGCDSIISINLTITSETISSFQVSACDSYTVPSGNEIYLVSGIYQDTIQNAVGCDSVMTIDVTINTVDTSLAVTKFSLTANQAGATYQWIDCQSNMSMPGETGQTFEPTINGTYAVEITSNGCVDTSMCFAMESVGINDPLFQSQISIYPNPTTGQFTVDLGNLYQSARVEISDLRGRVVLVEDLTQADKVDLNLNKPAGIYFIKIEADERLAVVKLVKN